MQRVMVVSCIHHFYIHFHMHKNCFKHTHARELLHFETILNIEPLETKKLDFEFGYFFF